MRYRTREGFTLVEMLVAVALTLFIMVLLSQAFAAGLEAFRHLKGIEKRVMAQDCMPVGGVANIKFEAITAMLQGQIESCQSILRSIL